MTPLARRLVAVAVTLLTALALVALGLEASGLAGVALPAPTPPASGVATPSPSLAPGPSASADARAAFAQIEEQVRAIRGLPKPSIGPAEIISRSQLEAELKASFEKDYPPARQRADNITLRAMGLLQPGQDVAALQLKLLSGQVIGFYDDTKKRMVVVTDSGLTPEARITYAHEYTHALQDAAFGLSSLELDAVGQDDRGLARLSLVEGDATNTMFRWATQHLSARELTEVAQTPVPDMTGIPGWMVQQLEVPYTAGFQFVMALQAQAGGGMSEVNAAFDRRPPASTEQVLHPEKYVADEAPMRVAAPSPAAALGAGWTQASSSPVGEAMIAITLQALGVADTTAATAAAGWGGDQLVVASGPGGAFALAWRLAWDSARDASQFAAAYATARGSLSFPAELRQLSDTQQLVVQASSQQALDAVMRSAVR